MRLLQAEDLRHHVVGGGMQQDPARGQADHDVAAHRRQADGDRIWTYDRQKELMDKTVQSQQEVL